MRLGLVPCVALAAGAGPFARAAAQAPALDEAEAEALDPVIVTARREQRLQATPQSVTTLNRGELERSNIDDVSDLALQVPGMVVSDQNASFGSANIFIRGVGTAVRGVGVSTGVALFRDGVYQPSPTSILAAFTDIERIEVVRGPQGVLQGRNATGGAVSIISRRPTDAFEAAADISAGAFGMRQARGSANLPLAPGLAVRGAFIAERRESYTRNLTRETAGLEADRDAELLALKGSALARLGPDATLLLRASHLQDESYAKFEARNAQPGGLFGVATALFKLPAPSLNGTDAFELRSDVVEPRGELEQSELSAEFNTDLGFASLRWISAVQHEESGRFIDGDGTDTPLSFNTLAGEMDSFSHELQLVSASADRLNWLAGLTLFGLDGRQDLLTEVFGGLVKTTYAARLENEGYAVFGQLDWRMRRTLTLSGGLRYSRETKRHRLLINGAAAGAATGEITDDDLSPSLVLQWRPTRATLAYASAAKGFKAGGFNSTQNQAPYGPETIWNYETGLKTRWWGGRMVVNASAFTYRYDQLQTQVSQASLGGVVSVLTPDAEAVGGEIELVAKPVEPALLRLGASYLDATVASHLSAVDPSTGALADVQGNRLPRAPRFTLSGAAEYRLVLRSGGALTPRLEVQHASAQDFDLFNSAAARQGAYTLWNGSLDVLLPGERVVVQLFGKNLTDQAYRVASVAATAPTGVGVVDFWGAPRTYGLRLGVRF